MPKAGKKGAREGQGPGARGGGSFKPVGGVSASTRGSKAMKLTKTPQEGAHKGHGVRVRGQGGAPEAAPSRLSARLAAARGPQVGARSARTSNTRASPGSAGAKPTSRGRTTHSCAKKPTMGDFIAPVIQGVAGSKTSGGDAGSNTSGITTRTRAANRSIASTSKGTVVVSDPNPFSPLRDLTDEATALAPALAHAPRRSKRMHFPHLTDADATAASVASGNKRARTFEASKLSPSASPSHQREKSRKLINKDASAVEPLSPPKTRAGTARSQRAAGAVADEAVRESESMTQSEPRRSGRLRAAAAAPAAESASEVTMKAVRDHDVAAAITTGNGPEATDRPGPRRSDRIRDAAAAPRSHRGAVAVADEENPRTNVAPRGTRANLHQSGQVVREMADALLNARALKRPSTPVPDAAEDEARRAADDARNTEADRFLASSLKKYTEGAPVTYGAAVRDIRADYRVVMEKWDAETAHSTPKPKPLKKSALTPREQEGIAQMDECWQGVARAHLEYGVPPPHSFPFQQWAHLDDALKALATDCPAMATLRQAGSFLGVFLTDGKYRSNTFSLTVANPEFCLATRDALPCVPWRVYEGVEFVGPRPHNIDHMHMHSISKAVFKGLKGPFLSMCGNSAKCPQYILTSTTRFKQSTTAFYPTSGVGKKRLPKTWLGVSRRAVILGLAATPAFEDGEMAGDGSSSDRRLEGRLSIAHCDLTKREQEFMIELKANPLRRDGTTGTLLYGGYPFAVTQESGLTCTEEALTAAGYRALGSSVRRTATIRYMDHIKSLPPSQSITARAYPHKLKQLDDTDHRASNSRMRLERSWDILAIAKMRLVEGLSTEQLTDRLRKERDQETLTVSQVQRMLLTPVGEFTTRGHLPGVGLWPSPVEKQAGVGSRISHRIDVIRLLNTEILQPVRDAGAAEIARFKKTFGAALENDCFLIDWDTLTAIVPICMVTAATSNYTVFTPEEHAAQLAYASRQPRYKPCVAPPADVLLDVLQKRSPAVVLSDCLEFIGDGSEWMRRERVERLTAPLAASEFLHKPTGYTTIELREAKSFHDSVLKFKAVGIKCAKDTSTGKPLFHDDAGWSTRGSKMPVLSATHKFKSIVKNRTNQTPAAA